MWQNLHFYLKFIHLKPEVASPFESFHCNDADVVLFQFDFELIYCLRKYEKIIHEKNLDDKDCRFAIFETYLYFRSFLNRNFKSIVQTPHFRVSVYGDWLITGVQFYNLMNYWCCLGSLHTTWKTFEITELYLSTVRRTVHSNPSRKGSFSKTLFKPDEFENDGLCF